MVAWRGMLLAGWLTMVAGSFVAAEDNEPRAEGIQLRHCLVSLVDEVRLPAREAGVLVKLLVHEGDQLEKGALLGQIDDDQPRRQKAVAEAEQRVADVKAASDVNIRYAQAAHKVAAKEFELNTEANRKVPGTRSLVEMQKLELTAKQAELQIEQSGYDHRVLEHEAEAAASKVSLANGVIERSELHAPFSGELVEVLVHEGEWLQPGDPIFHLVRLDRLRIEAFVKVNDWHQGELKQRKVRVTATLAHGQSETFEGRIVFVNSLVQAGGDYRVWAEVDNRRANDAWLLSPGLEVDMTILPHEPEVAEQPVEGPPEPVAAVVAAEVSKPSQP